MNKIDVPIILFLLGSVLMSGPFLRIFDGNLPIYLFSVWISSIALLARPQKEKNRQDDG